MFIIHLFCLSAGTEFPGDWCCWWGGFGGCNHCCWFTAREGGGEVEAGGDGKGGGDGEGVTNTFICNRLRGMKHGEFGRKN